MKYGIIAGNGRFPVIALETPKGGKQMSLNEIVTLAKHGISDAIIVRQIELTESIFALTTNDILHLNQSGVSNVIIRAMQESRPVPYRIHGAVAPASSSR